MKPRDGQLNKEQLEWCRIHLPAFAKFEPMASAAEADTAAYRARYQSLLDAQNRNKVISDFCESKDNLLIFTDQEQPEAQKVSHET